MQELCGIGFQITCSCAKTISSAQVMHQDISIVTSDRLNAPDDDDRVVPFRPRSTAAGGRRWRWPQHSEQQPPPPVEGLARYEGGEHDDTYRHRMLVNLAALVFTIALASGGVWLAIQMSELRKTQDCFLSGRRNCVPIEVKALPP